MAAARIKLRYLTTDSAQTLTSEANLAVQLALSALAIAFAMPLAQF